jgi:hypothetical protein
MFNPLVDLCSFAEKEYVKLGVGWRAGPGTFQSQYELWIRLELLQSLQLH